MILPPGVFVDIETAALLGPILAEALQREERRGVRVDPRVVLVAEHCNQYRRVSDLSAGVSDLSAADDTRPRAPDTCLMLTPTEAAPLLAVSARTVQRRCAAGELGFAVGGVYRIPLYEIERVRNGTS